MSAAEGETPPKISVHHSPFSKYFSCVTEHFSVDMHLSAGDHCAASASGLREQAAELQVVLLGCSVTVAVVSV
jgi:hypothetical protein